MHLHLGIFWLLEALLCLSGIGIGNRALRAEAWTALGNYHNDAYPGKCTIMHPLVISPGESIKKPGACAEYYCGSANGDATIIGCGKTALPAGCKWGAYIDKNAPLPKCCDRLSLRNSEGEKNMNVIPQNYKTESLINFI